MEEVPLLRHIQKRLTDEDNRRLNDFPSMEEVKKVVFDLNGDSASGIDGFTGHFFQQCWDIIGDDVVNVVGAFFNGVTLPKSITHTNLVLLPNKDICQSFSDMRPISLSNFLNKVISRVMNDRVGVLFPSLISENQFGFVKGRSITENVLLAQEIIVDIRKRGKPANVVIKLDMAKSYDMANGFFHSSRGVKQGDPLSPALFILTAEVLSQSLNASFCNEVYKGFGLPTWSDQINHLAYVDDTIIFTSANGNSLDVLMTTLRDYEKQSGQMINKEKSSFFVFHNTSHDLILDIEAKTGFIRGKFPLMYLGCPIGHAKKKRVPLDSARNVQLDKVKQCFLNGEWNYDLLQTSFGNDISRHIIQFLRSSEDEQQWNKPWWMLKTSGKFTVGSAWDFLRKKQEVCLKYKYIWSAGIPFKISFFNWRPWKQKLPIGEVLIRNMMGDGVVINRCGEPFLKDTLYKWWNADVSAKLKPVLMVVPLFICWQVWRRRNALKFGGSMSYLGMRGGIANNLILLARQLYPWMYHLPNNWPELVRYLTGYTPRIGCKVVYWKLPRQNTFK
ncbi:uncharacterized protein LOC125863926 [Solanum stenotomum]|uniref:uncharacterized protein LOC125863926 n=1 Tax=Solanum stenotomum TaxID=172797 RepID=UPI0020D10DFB|nr:uncharacterized protein LOC125863926 [Solanum stenotomum]